MLWVILASMLFGAVGQAMLRRRQRLARLPPADDPRWSGESRPQVAGKKCIECGTKVLVAADGDACKQCGEIGHLKKCLKQHARSAHRVVTDVPYR